MLRKNMTYLQLIIYDSTPQLPNSRDIPEEGVYLKDWQTDLLLASHLSHYGCTYCCALSVGVEGYPGEGV